MTLQKLIQEKCGISTSLSEGFRANPIRFADADEDLTIPEEVYSLNLPELLKTSSLQLFCLKMFPDSYHMTKTGLFKRSSVRFRNWGILSNGWCITAHVSESHNQGGGCTLSDIAVPNVPDKYFLSSAAIAKALSRL